MSEDFSISETNLSERSPFARPRPRPRPGGRLAREAAAVLLPTAGAGLALALAPAWKALAPRGSFPEPFLLLLLALLTTALVLHRPFEGPPLGAGALAVPPTLVLLGGVPAAWVAAGGLLLAELARRTLRQRAPSVARERRRPWRSLELAGMAALAVVAAAVTFHLTSPTVDRLDETAGTASAPGPLAAAGLAYGVVLATLLLLDKKLRRPQLPIPWKDGLAPLGADLAAWAVGTAAAAVAVEQGWPLALALLGGMALLALEAARNAFRHGLSAQRVEDLERLRRANRRIAGTDERGLAAVAERIRIECVNVVRFQWFQFELLARESGHHSWWAGPDGSLSDGEPSPPRTPPALPGIHRRSSWQVLERALETGEQLVGRLRLWCDPRQLEPESVKLLESLLPQMLASVERALLDREAKQDPLTGLAVRRVLEDRLEKAFQRACDHGETMAVLMCDLDFFKRINDTHGHAAGDQALIATARLLLERQGEGRLCARYGGEEFTVLLEDGEGTQALALAEELRLAVEELEVRFEGEAIPLTLSVGAAAFPDLPVKRPEELLELADTALYEAKAQGRNRALLNLGRGTFRAPDGEVITAADAPEASEAPRFFA